MEQLAASPALSGCTGAHSSTNRHALPIDADALAERLAAQGILPGFRSDGNPVVRDRVNTKDQIDELSWR